MTNELTGGQSITKVEGKGTMPSSVGEEYKANVLTFVKNLFVASGIKIPVLEYTGPSRKDDQLYVRFHSDLGEYKVRRPCLSEELLTATLDGWAYQRIDRFNKSLGNEVALFLDPNKDDAQSIAGTIAHEAGHALGLKHILRSGAPETEIMDYNQPREKYADTILDITEPPDDAIRKNTPECVSVKSDNHNPTYHLRRYAVKEDKSKIDQLPGSWDIGVWERALLRIDKFFGWVFGSEIYNVAMIASETAALGPGSEGSLVFGFFETVDVEAPSGLEWVFSTDEPVQILASSRPGDEWDLFFTTSAIIEKVGLNAESANLTPSDLAPRDIEGQIVQFDSSTDTYRIVGNFSAVSEIVARISSDDALSATPGQLQFDPTEVGAYQDLVVTLQNYGLADLAGSCTVASPFELPNGCAFFLPPGGSTNVVVRFAPTTIYPVSGHVSISSSGGDGIVLTRGRGDDGDGVPLADDLCPDSDRGATVVIDECDSLVDNALDTQGCTISDKVTECGDNAANHGEFVSCVAKLTNVLESSGEINGREKGEIQSCAANSSIGK